MCAVYRWFFNTFFRRMDPEAAHHLVYTGLSIVGKIPVLRDVIQGALAPYLGRKAGGPGSVRTMGITFPAPFGLAGGFDKDAAAVHGLWMLGFGHIEIGTVTPRAQDGNPAPRMWREVEMDSLRNAMGFNNQGAHAAAAQLRRLRSTAAGRAVVVGVNIGKNRVTPPESAAADYALAATVLTPYADYLVVNVSSPNTPGLRDLQSVESLRPILEATRSAADAAQAEVGGARVPLLVKVAPDLSDDDIDAIAALVTDLGVDGVVAVNTSINHDLGPGGLSGPPLKARGLEVVERLRRHLGEDATIIGCGGIQQPDDAREYLRAGANLVQGYTGFVYVGPLWPRRINTALVADAVG
ncbi:MAG: quinone-dependent dihydroorotate dehydrogenase [Cellulomonadaceae bacterium]|jgi:dihydroorotate dehydrogenase|nr:quinone-dependent dihydroorotate dehydrogenase [Cellulomonadaceae bacterium]